MSFTVFLGPPHSPGPLSWFLLLTSPLTELPACGPQAQSWGPFALCSPILSPLSRPPSFPPSEISSWPSFQNQLHANDSKTVPLAWPLSWAPDCIANSLLDLFPPWMSLDISTNTPHQNMCPSSLLCPPPNLAPASFSMSVRDATNYQLLRPLTFFDSSLSLTSTLLTHQ